MPLLFPRSPRAISLATAGGAPAVAGRLLRARADRDDPTVPALLEFQSPSAAVLALPVPRAARGIIWVVTSLFAACILALGLIKIDRVVSAQGKVVSQAATIVVQPLETAIVRSIDVKEGQLVHAGDVLARLDPTFATADLGALAVQVGALQAEVSRLQAEAQGQPFAYTGSDPALSLQAALFASRAAERSFKLENYRQKIAGLQAQMQRAKSDVAGYAQRVQLAQQVVAMREELERDKVGSKLNTKAAQDALAEVMRALQGAINTVNSTSRDLEAMMAERDGFVQSDRADISQKLAEATQKLSDARENLNKAQLRKNLVVMLAEHDATVLTVSHVSVGSVMQSGDPLITMVPTDAPLEVEANIAGRDDGFVHVGDPVAIKFDTFPFSQYGLARGTVRTISADSFTASDDARSRNGGGAVPIAAQSTEPFYRGRLTITENQLHDVPPGFRITPGMPVTTDIKVGEHTVLNYLMGRVLPTAMEGMREP